MKWEKSLQMSKSSSSGRCRWFMKMIITGIKYDLVVIGHSHQNFVKGNVVSASALGLEGVSYLLIEDNEDAVCFEYITIWSFHSSKFFVENNSFSEERAFPDFFCLVEIHMDNMPVSGSAAMIYIYFPGNPRRGWIWGKRRFILSGLCRSICSWNSSPKIPIQSHQGFDSRMGTWNHQNSVKPIFPFRKQTFRDGRKSLILSPNQVHLCL